MFWHSSAHVLGEAAERHYGCHLCLGPPTDEGFFYEMGMGGGSETGIGGAEAEAKVEPEKEGLRTVSNSDYPALEKVAEMAIKEKQKFERLVVSKENLLKMFHVRAYPRSSTHFPPLISFI